MTSQAFESAGVNFTAQPSSLKMSITLNGWNFSSSNNHLVALFSLGSTPPPPITSMITSSSSDTETVTLLSSETLTTIRLLKYATVDGIDDVSVGITPSNDNALGTAQLSLQFPHFGSTLLYDPDFSVLVSPNEGGGDGQPNLLGLIALVAVPVTIVVAICTVLVVVAAAFLMRRQRRRRINARHNIHFDGSESVNEGDGL